MWPEPVERIAEFVRSSGAEGRLEQLPPGAEPPAPAVRAVTFRCNGGAVVALVPAERRVDRTSLAAEAGCGNLDPAPAEIFPFQGTRVFVERSLLTAALVWLEAGAPRHVLGLAPSELIRLTRAHSADVVVHA